MDATQTKDAAGEFFAVLRDARLWVDHAVAPLRGLSPVACEPGEALLKRIDAALASQPAASRGDGAEPLAWAYEFVNGEGKHELRFRADPPTGERYCVNIRPLYEHPLVAPSIPAPVAPEAGNDLRALSAKATPGDWCAHLVLEMTPTDSDFCDALVNAYRSGRLVEASASPPPGEDLAGQGDTLGRAAFARWSSVDPDLQDKIWATMADDVRAFWRQQEDDQAVAAILAAPDAEMAAQLSLEREAELRAEVAAVASLVRPQTKILQILIRDAIADCSTVDWYNLSEAGVDNLALLAANAAATAPAPSRPADRTTFTCAARKGNVGAGDPQECDWPVCGCDPHADKVIAALQESGLLRDADRGGGDGTQAARDVLAERRRQFEAEGWTAEHDDAHAAGEMCDAAASYAYNSRPNARSNTIPGLWPWADAWWKPTTPRRDLVKAGALILAEIERLDRAAQGDGQ